jgi:TolB-like protein/Tfp pilus assembly protein PilF
VLPFENLSPYPDSAYLADGIQEEILTRLANIADLRVISHTSTRHYQTKPRNLGEIGKQLGVANVLEGSVQKIADQVRVNVRLVNAQTDSHLWADTYDRKLTDIFGIESEISKRIAHSLQVKLSGREEQALAAKPTNNPEAYDAYLRGLSVEARNYTTAYSRDLLEKTAGFYERAVQLDPNFALAWAQLSRTNARLYFNDDHTAARRDGAKIDLENAQKLEPDSPETLLALGYYQYWVLRDYESATTTFNRVRKMVPGNSDLPIALGRVARREGHWDESIAYFDQALTLDPRNIELLVDAAWTYAMLRQFPAALRLYDRALDITPNNLDVMAVKACSYQAQGDLQQAASLLSEINSVTPVRDTFFAKITQLRLERHYSEAIALLQNRLAQLHANSSSEMDVRVQLALTQRLAGDAAGAKATAEQVRNTLEAQAAAGAITTSAPVELRLSEAYAAMGENDLALKEAQRAIALSPSAKDRVGDPGLDENLAFIQMILGDKGRAISTLTRLLQTPYASRIYRPMPITRALLRLDPLWDPLRSDPRFQELCQDKLDKSITVQKAATR